MKRIPAKQLQKYFDAQYDGESPAEKRARQRRMHGDNRRPPEETVALITKGAGSKNAGYGKD